MANQRRSKLATLKKRFALAAVVCLAILPVLSACGTTATPTPAPQATNTAGAAASGPDVGAGVAALEAEGIQGNPSASGKLEFFSWWTAGGEKDGKEDILDLYSALYPTVEVVDAAVAGGGGDQAKQVLKTRMQGNDPPDTFQVHGGPELLAGFVDADRMDSIQDVWDELKLGDALPQQLQDMVSKDGTPYAVPANVHRGNVLFYNKKVFTDNNLTAPTTWEEFMTAADALKSKGITPLGVGGKDTWAVTMLFEDLLLANGGADKFNSLMAGETEWTDESVVQSLTMLAEMVTKGYFGDNFSGLTWDAAAGEVLKGTAAMTVMGDWAKGYFQANDPQWADNFGWVPSPGTSGIFKVITDAFGLPKGAKNPDNTKAFLRVLGSKTGQVTFNLRKGSIPARTDVDTSQFDVYMKDAAKDFGEAKSLVGSAPHGSATVEAFASQLNTAINTFVSNPADAAAAAQGIQAQATDLLK